MFAPVRYIAWARKFYGLAEYELATSGIPLASWADLGGVPEPDLEDPAAYDRFREALAKYNDVPLNEVTPALGTTHAVFLAYASVLSPGDEVLVEHPGYEPLTRTAEGLGAKVRTFELRASEGWAIDPERVAAAITPRTRLIVVTTHHNPTGVVVPDETLRELARIAEAHGAYLLVDEVYAPFQDLPEDGVFKTSARKLGPNVLAVGSLTKCYGLGFYRIGFLLAPPDLTLDAENAVIATNGHLPLAHAARGAVATAHVGALAKRAKKLLAGKRELVAPWVATLPRATWSNPPSGLYGLVTLEGAGNLQPRIEEWATKHSVLVAAGSFFGLENAFRLSWASLDRPKFEEGLERLGRLLRA